MKKTMWEEPKKKMLHEKYVMWFFRVSVSDLLPLSSLSEYGYEANEYFLFHSYCFHYVLMEMINFSLTEHT